MFTEHKRAKSKNSLIFILSIMLVLTSFASTEARTKRRRSSRTLWEYNVVTIMHANTGQRKTILNDQGRDGWELISSEDDKSGTGETTFYFKRLRRQNSRRHR